METRPDRLLIWGAGGHGKVVADLIRGSGHDLIGFVDADVAKLGLTVEPGGAMVTIAEAELLALFGKGEALPGGATAVVPALGNNAIRHAAVDRIGRYISAALLHPFATVSPSVVLGDGSVVLAGAIVNAAAWIGRGAILNSAAIVEHDCKIGDAVHISPGAVLAGGVTVGPRSWIGAGAVVIEGVTIGRDVTVGAGSIVIRNVPDGETVVGNPARTLRRDA